MAVNCMIDCIMICFDKYNVIPPNSFLLFPLRYMQGCQVMPNFNILLLKLRLCYWNFHEILSKTLKFVSISQSFPHKNTEVCVKVCKNTKIIGICYLSEFPEVGSPVNGPHLMTGLLQEIWFCHQCRVSALKWESRLIISKFLKIWKVQRIVHPHL